MAGTHEGSFVFAIRLAKIHKGWLRSQWSLGPMPKGATFNHGVEEVDVTKVLSEEGFWAEVVEDRELGCAIVVRSNRKYLPAHIDLSVSCVVEMLLPQSARSRALIRTLWILGMGGYP